MAKAVVTQERVFEVAQALTDQGTAPTILNVQEGIGGGSYTTVKRYLDQWREAAPKQRQPGRKPEKQHPQRGRLFVNTQSVCPGPSRRVV